MPRGKANGPDGLPIEFYWSFWSTIQVNIMELLSQFMSNQITIQCLNKAAVTLIPKKCNSEKVSDHRPISIINTVAKIITKIMTNRLQPHLSTLITHN